MSMSSLTFEEALADLVENYGEVPERERARVLRSAANRLHHPNQRDEPDEKPIMSTRGWD
jgi:hypothetical protein